MADALTDVCGVTGTAEAAPPVAVAATAMALTIAAALTAYRLGRILRKDDIRPRYADAGRSCLTVTRWPQPSEHYLSIFSPR